MEKRLPKRAGSRKRVDTQTGHRYVTPAVRLERKQISMLNPQPGAAQPSPAPDSQPVSTSDVPASTTATTITTATTTTTTTTRTTIVGKKGPLEEEGSSLVPKAPPRNGQSPGPTTEEPKTMMPTTSPTEKQEPSPPPPAEEQEPTTATEMGKYRKEGDETKGTEQETRTPKELSQETKEGTKQELKRTQELTKEETQALSSRTATIGGESEGERTTPATTEHEPSTTKDDAGRRSPDTMTRTEAETTPAAATSSAPSPQASAEQQPPALRLETADLMEYFEEQAPVRKDSGIQIAEQSVRPETTSVMEFFEEQPVRQQSVQVPRQVAARQETAEVIEFFEEQDQSLEDVQQQGTNLLTVPSPHHHHHHQQQLHGGSLQRGQRSPSPGMLHPSVGLNHLDNLIRLMEQLSNLKDENAKLRKKCDYLETTKNLLKARSELMSTSDSSSAASGHFQSLPSSHHKGHVHRHHHRNGSGTRDAEGSHRPRLFSAEDVQCLEISESASDSRPKRPKGPLHKRSFSTGSLEVEILDETSMAEGRKSKSGKNVVGAKSPKQKSKGSKWARVKKVFKGQFWYEDLGTTLKSLKELGRSAQRYSTVGTEVPEFASQQQQHQRSLDTSLEAELMGAHRLPQRAAYSIPSAEASSAAGRSPNIPGPGDSGGSGVEELGTEIWMGPPGWWEQYEASKQGEASTSSDVSSVIEVKTMYLGSSGSKPKDTERLLKVKPLTRRQSSPSLSTKASVGGGVEPGEEEDEGEEGGEGEGTSHIVHRSASYKDEDLMHKEMSSSGTSTGGGGGGGGGGKTDSKKLHRKAWGRVKDIIHVRKDSVKKKSRRGAERETSEWSQGEEISEVDLEGLMEEQLSVFGEGMAARSTPKTSPMVMPRQATSKSFSESPPQTDPLAASKTTTATTTTSPDMAALLATSMSEEFAQKMQAWQELQLRKSSSFKVSGGGGDGEGSSESRAGLQQLQQDGSVETTTAAAAAQTEVLALSASSPAITTLTTSAGEPAVDSKARVKGALPSQSQSLPSDTPDGATTTTTTTTSTSPPQQPAPSSSPSPSPAATVTAATTAASPLPQAEASSSSPTELQAHSVNVEELQRRISESFSRKLAEWERRKYRGRPTTPEMEHKGSARSRKEKEKDGKEERSRSKKSREEKERERLEKQREREMQKVEKEQVKLEKEKVRIEKERQRALEKQAKLERMKGRLSQADTDPSSSSSSYFGQQQQQLPLGSASPPPYGAGFTQQLSFSGAPQDTTVTQCKVTAEFKKKLDDWQQMKSGSLMLPSSPDLTGGTSSPEGASSSPQPSSPPPIFPTLGPQPSGKPPPIMLQPYYADTPEERSPVEKAASDVSYGDDSTSVTEEGGYTRTNITSLERANDELLREVTRKEDEYSMLQEEVQKLNSKLDKVRQEHAAEMARFRRELEAGTVAGPVQLEVGELESTVRELEEKIALMENAGDQLAESMETAAIGKWQSVEGEEVVSQQLVEMVDQMRAMLVQASVSRELSQKTMALHNFEKVYCHAMKLQVQMNNLRVSQLERNKEIMLIKRQLLLQEVNNVLLQAHITRRETELYQYREARRLGLTGVRRWNTFSGQGDRYGDSEARPTLLRNVSLQDNDDPYHPSSSSPPVLPQLASTTSASSTKPSSKHDDIPCMTDEDASIPAAGIAEGTSGGVRVTAGGQLSSSPSSPLTTTTTSTSSATTTTTTITTTATTTQASTSAEQSKDQQESQVVALKAAVVTTTSSQAPTTRDAMVHGLMATTNTHVVDSGEALAKASTCTSTPSDALPGPAADVSKMPTTSAPPLSTSLPPSGEAETTAKVVVVPPAAAAAKTSGKETTKRETTKTETTKTVVSAGAEVSKVETGSPTLLTPMAEEVLKKKCPETETPVQPTIPERPDTGGDGEKVSPPAPQSPASPEDDNYSQPESVMECTKSVLGPEASSRPVGAGEPPSQGSPSQPPAAAAGGVDIPSKGPANKAAVRSPVLRQRYLRRQKEEREKQKDRSASPKSTHSGDSGKPPLPRQSTPHQSPSPTHRSKSVGDMEGFEPDKSTSAAAPLQDVIQKFEKRATVCETEERKIEFRKTPSPTLHLPRVGLVSRIRRLKPAAELLQESQRYRSGHSIYATRIMQRYLPGKAPQSGAATITSAGSQDKENISGQSYVQNIVKRLSRENTPVRSAGSSSASSTLSLHRTHSPGKVHSEIVSGLVQKLSSSIGPSDSHKTASSPPPVVSGPLKDVTNEGQVKKLSKTLSTEEESPPGPSISQQQGHLAGQASDRTRAAGEGVSVQSASVTEAAPQQAKPESTISPASHTSMPALASDQPPPSSAEDGTTRERAATYCVSEADRPRSQHLRGAADNGSESIEHIAEEFLDPALLSIRERKGQKISPSSSTNSKNALCCQSSACTKSKSSSSSSSSPLASRGANVPSSPKSQERRGAGKEKMETIGVLCKQSMSFDLGVSLRAQSPEAMPQRPQSAESLRPVPEVEAGSREGGAKARPSSTSSEGEAAASSEEKKKSRARFLDSSWLQKPKKFFKVSK